MPVPPAGHSSSIDSTSSYGSSKSSLLAAPIDPVSSQSDIADSSPPHMPRGDLSAYALAASPSQDAYRANNLAASAISASQKFKRAFGKRRRPSQDATSMLSSGDERSASDSAPAPVPSSFHAPQNSLTHPSIIRPSAAKLTMHLFGGRKSNQPQHDASQPPPLPPKPTATNPPAPSAPHVPPNVALKLSSNASGSRPRSSIIATSPSINPAIEFMREDEERQQLMQRRRDDPVTRELAQNKEDWRKSDSTVASSHTVKPSRYPDGISGSAGKRRSTLSSQNAATELGLGLELHPASQALNVEAHIDSSDPTIAKQAKRRSLSLNIHTVSRQHPASTPLDSVPSEHPPPLSSLRPPPPTFDATDSHPSRSPSPIPGLRGAHSPSYSVTLSPASHDSPTLTHTAANGIIGSGAASGSPIKTNIRGRLAAWTAATNPRGRSPSPLNVPSISTPSLSSPSVTSLNQSAPHRRVHATSNATQPSPEMQAIALVRDMHSRTRSPSTSSMGTSGIRQAATGAGAMAFGFGKRAYEKVGRVWAGAGSGSGSGSDTPNHHYSSPAATSGGEDHLLTHHHGPSAFPAHGKRTQNAPSGTWSVSSLSGGSRSSSERDPVLGRETSPSGPGKLVRPPRSTGNGVVFGRELWECVRDTRATVSANQSFTGRMIPALVLRCAQHLHKWGIQEEGLFRISGRTSHITRLRQEFDSGADYDIIDCSPSDLDPHAVASVFKAYLRELPEPILTRALAPLFDTAMNAENSRVAPATPTAFKSVGSAGPSLPSGPRAVPMMRKPPSLSTFTLPTSTTLRAPSTTLVETLGDLVARLPRENRDLLETVIDLMRATAAQSKETKMPLSNLMLVFCPSLNMSPTLLRVLCDAPGVWERAREPPVVDIVKPPAAAQDEGEESDDSDSDSVSSYGNNSQVVALPSMYKGVDGEGEMPAVDSPFIMPMVPSEDVEPPPRTESPVSVSLTRPRAVRRVPVPAVLLDERHLDRSSPLSSRSVSPPPLTTEPVPFQGSPSPPGSTSSPSLHVPSRSVTPLSAVSLTSAPAIESEAMVPPQRSRQFSLPLASSGYVAPAAWGSPDHNKDLPASPRSPAYPETEDRASGPPPLRVLTELPERTSSRPLPQIPPSHSAPSVVFPSVTTPTTPTSLKKHAISLSSGRHAKVSSDDEGSPSSPRRIVRRPSLNLLFNLKRGGSPSPRSRTPTISSPLSISSPIAPTSPSVESSPETVTHPLPPVLSLPSLDTSADAGLGLGWDDVFGNNIVNETALAQPQPPSPPQLAQLAQPRPTAISQPSLPQPPRFQTPPSTPRRPTTEFLLSSGGFFSANGPPLALPSPASVLEAANVGAGARAASPRDGEAESAASQEDSSSGPDSPEVDSPVREIFTPRPHLSFQLRRSSMEEDWASAVLWAAGKPAEPLA